MKILIKSGLLCVLAIVVCFNYKVLNFTSGCSFALPQAFPESDWIKNTKILLSIEKVYYYETPFKNDDYVIFVETENNELYSTNGNEDVIKSLELAGIIYKNATPIKVTTIPLWLVAILALVIIFFPTRRKKKKRR